MPVVIPIAPVNGGVRLHGAPAAPDTMARCWLCIDQRDVSLYRCRSLYRFGATGIPASNGLHLGTDPGARAAA